ncbi:hypothetical protein GCM10027589_27460 [Actinocorallia lasiicapitis]
MDWAMFSVVLGFAGVSVLAYCAVRVFAGVRSLGGELERTRKRLEPGQAELKRQVDALKRRAE